MSLSQSLTGTGACKAVRLPFTDVKLKLGGKATLLERKNLASWAQLAMGQLLHPTWSQSPRLLTRPGPQAVPGRARRGWATSLPRSKSTQLQFNCVPLASRTSESQSWTEPSRGWLLPDWHCSCPQMASLGVGRQASRVGRRSTKLPTNSGKAHFLHLPRGTRHVATTGAAPTVPKGITPSVGCLKAKRCSRLGLRSPK